MQLNNHNIHNAERAILDAYRFDEENSVYKQLEQAPYYSIMHDGISKFGVEYNGVYLRGTDANHAPLNVPYCLSKMKGGVTGVDNANAIISNVAAIIECDNTAKQEVLSSFNDEFSDVPNYIAPTPPEYFKIGNFLDRDQELMSITIQDHDRFPIVNIGNGVAVNIKGACVLRELYGFMSPDFRCSAHAASGSIKRMTTSRGHHIRVPSHSD